MAENNFDKVLSIIKANPKSKLRIFLDLPAPRNDEEYLHLWFNYINFSYERKDLVAEFLTHYGVTEEDFHFKYHLSQKIDSLIDSAFVEKKQQIDFHPRLEKYLLKFKKSEREDIRQLLIVFLYSNVEIELHLTQITLFSLFSSFHLNRTFIYGLTKKHQLFQDDIMNIDEADQFGGKRSFLHSDIHYDPAVYKLFAALELKDFEVVGIPHNPLLKEYHIVDDDFLNAVNPNNTKFNIDDKELVENAENKVNLEDIFKSDFQINVPPQKNKKLNKELEINQPEILPYENDLDYFLAEYQWISILFRLETNRRGDAIGTKDSDSCSSFEMEQEIRMNKNLCEIRLKKSKEIGYFPRLEYLREKINLNEFELNVLKIMVAHKTFQSLHRFDAYDFRSKINVALLLSLLFADSVNQVKNKKYFLKSSKLRRYNLIQVSTSDPFEESIYNAEVNMDNSLLAYLTGDDIDISDYFESNIVYSPNVKLDSVIIENSKKEKIIEMIENFPSYLKIKNKITFSNVADYGNALVILLVGPSGTGKTLTANAVSTYLGKKMLNINLNNNEDISSIETGGNKIIPFLFRESRIKDSLLFFDESEVLLKNRSPELLLEIERHNDIVIFATNASFKIDEAMRRRINMIIQFDEPGASHRKKIWKLHLPKENLSKKIDLDYISRKFEINGGLIKNAVYSALSHAVSNSKNSKVMIEQKDIEYGAREQLYNKLFMSSRDEKRIPIRGIDSMVLPTNTVKELHEIINFEKAKKVLYGQWGFKDIFHDSKGTTVLFYGPSGTGKTLAAESIAFETGKTLQIVNYSQIISKWVGESSKAIESLLTESVDDGSILLFDEADSIFAKRTTITGSTDRYANLDTDVLLSLMERNNVFAILTTNYKKNIDSAFFRRLSFVVEFKEPTQQQRLKLWRKLLPPKLPLSKDVDLPFLAKTYFFNGGDIKNVIIRSATKKAINLRDDVKVTLADFIEVCDAVSKAKNETNFNKIGFVN